MGAIFCPTEPWDHRWQRTYVIKGAVLMPQPWWPVPTVVGSVNPQLWAVVSGASTPELVQ